MTIRRPGRSGYPVDGNEKFYIDGEETASIEFQGLEDSFGFSWGFPPTESMFPLTGWFPFLKGAAGYRFFTDDAISFDKSLRVTIGFGANEDPMFRREFSKPGSQLQLSSVVYWYQKEPHASLPTMPAGGRAGPGPGSRLLAGQGEAARGRGSQAATRAIPHAVRPAREGSDLRRAGLCRRSPSRAITYDGWSLPVYHCRADNKQLRIELTVPKAATGTLRLYMIDPDNFEGGRKQTVSVAGKSLGLIENFQEGRWLEQPVAAQDNAEGKLLIEARNAREGSNAVISIIEFVGTRIRHA